MTAYPPNSSSNDAPQAPQPSYAPYPPAYPAPYGQYGQYAPYPTPYAPYPYYGQPYFPPTVAPATEPPNQAEVAAAQARGRRYQIIFAVVAGSVTALALLLAIVAPDLGVMAGGLTPATWQSVYHSNLTTPTAQDYRAWDVTKGCAFYSTGLDANGANGAGDSAGDAICAFQPSSVGADLSQGFSLELDMTPAANVSSFQESVMALGDVSSATSSGLWFEVGQDGHYIICDATCRAGDAVYITGASAAWHGDAYVANSFAARVSANHTDETFYINGQQIAEVALDLGTQPALAIGAPGGSETIFTAVRLSTGS